MRADSVVCEGENALRKKGGGDVVMDTPEKNKNTQIATPISKFEDSPVFNFLNNLSPIQPVKAVHVTHTFNALNFASLPSVFTSPHVTSLKESRFLRRHQLPDPSQPEFSSDHDHIPEKPELDVAINVSEQRESIDPEDGIVDDASAQISRMPVGKTECSCPSSVTVVNMGADGQVEENKEDMDCEWESLITDSGDLLIFDSPSDADAFKKAMGPSPSPANEMLNVEAFCAVGYGEEVGDGSETQNQSTQPGDGTEIQTHARMPDPSLNNPMIGGPNETDGLYRGMRRRCLVFEMGGPRRQPSMTEHDANNASTERRLVTASESSRCILPGIGLHLNALAAAAPRDGTGVKKGSLALGKQLIIGPGSAACYHSVTSTCQESLPVVSSANDDLNPSSPKKKKRRLETKESEGCKRCNCKKSKCLKLYCECFAAGVYCVEQCLCQDCFNKPIHEDTVLATRKQIESRNPLAFAPKVIRTAESMSETGDDSNKTPSSARHKRGCNCKKSGCLKKYCECYQGGVGCSINCRCEGCKNAFGRKDGSGSHLEEEEEEEETDITDKTVDGSSQKLVIYNEMGHIPDSVLPATPIRFKRPPLQFPYPSKNRPPRSSFLSVGSSSSGGGALYPSYPAAASQGYGRPSHLHPPQPNVEKQFDGNKENEIPEMLQTNRLSPTSGVKSSGSPNSKRVTPPDGGVGASPGRRSTRKLILQSIPTFPSLTPNQ